jgi:hypothetical protein
MDGSIIGQTAELSLAKLARELTIAIGLDGIATA